MEHRPLGRTGVSVSKLCLGAMMFGAWGNPDHDESIRIIHAALDAGINFIDTADVYARGESEEIVGKALAGGRRDDVILATKFHGAMGDETPTSRAARAAGSSARSRTRCGGWAPTGSTSTRSTARDPDTDIEETLGARSRPRAPGQGPLHRPLHLPGEPDRRGAVGRTRAQSAAFRHRAAGVLDPRARDRGRRPAHLRPVRHGRHLLQPARRRLAVGPLAQGRRSAGLLARRAGCPSASTSPSPPTSASSTRSSSSRSSPTRPGITLIELAIAFVLNHPAITAAIIGPRTMEQLESQLAAADVVLDAAILDRIDEIVPPGTTVNPADIASTTPRWTVRATPLTYRRSSSARAAPRPVRTAPSM